MPRSRAYRNRRPRLIAPREVSLVAHGRVDHRDSIIDLVRLIQRPCVRIFLHFHRAGSDCSCRLELRASGSVGGIAFGRVEHPHVIGVLACRIKRVCSRIEVHEDRIDSDCKRRKDVRAACGGGGITGRAVDDRNLTRFLTFDVNRVRRQID